MNTSVQGIIVNNCQYAPIYLIQDPATTQANTYVFAANNVQQPKPICNNLKSFYENSGNIENGLINVDAAVKPTATKKKDSILIGNNLKLASFLLPKSDNVNKQYFVENVDIKPQITTPISTASPAQPPVNIVPKIDMDRKIVKVKDIPVMNRTRVDKLLPKIKPKQNPPDPNQSKFTAVQLINVGGTYHSMNHLSKDQMKIVNQALKMFKDPDKGAAESTGEAARAPSTRYLYKVVSPKDLRIVGQKKYIVKDKKVTKIPRRVAEERVARQAEGRAARQAEDEALESEPPAETKFTRSGRKVKLPKQIVPEDSPHKAKKKTGTIVSCFQCSAEFGSLYRLQKHYEHQPTHIPAKIHSNLFHCLLAIVKSSGGDKANMFVQQLQQLVAKLRSLLPCLLQAATARPPSCTSAAQACSIGDDIARMFGMTPGKYYIDVDALNCVKDKDGFCIHNPPKTNQCNKDKPSAQGLSSDETLSPASESENCARINSVAKWPTVSKRIWKKKTHETSAKKMRLKSEGDTLIDLGTEELTLKAEEHVPSATPGADHATNMLDDKQERVAVSAPAPAPANVSEATHFNSVKNNYVQFHSAHFDIRSSPIKSSSTVFRKFQINPSKMSNYQVQVIRSLEMLDKADNKQVAVSSNSDSITHAPLSTSDNRLHINLPATTTTTTSTNSFHGTIPSATNSLHESLHRSENASNATLGTSNKELHVNLPVSVSMQVKLPISNNDLHLTLRSINNGLPDTLPSIDNNLPDTLPSIDNSLSDTLPSIDNSLSDTLPSIDNSLPDTLPNSDSDLHVNDNSFDITLTNTENSLHDIFKDGVDLACKEDSNIDSDLKEWIISTSGKSRDSLKSFTNTSKSLIEAEFVRAGANGDRCIDKSVSDNIGLPSLDETDNRLLTSQGDSVLNFLDNLSNDLVYPETEIRNNGVDFQLDLFTFHNSV